MTQTGLLTPATLPFRKDDCDSGFSDNTPLSCSTTPYGTRDYVKEFRERKLAATPRQLKRSKQDIKKRLFCWLHNTKGQYTPDCSPPREQLDSRFFGRPQNKSFAERREWPNFTPSRYWLGPMQEDPNMSFIGHNLNTTRAVPTLNVQARKRKIAFLKQKREFKENIHKSTKKSRGVRTPERNIKNISSCKQPLEKKISWTRYNDFLEVANTVQRMEMLLKCRKCQSASKIESDPKYSAMYRALCAPGEFGGPYFPDFLIPCFSKGKEVDSLLNIGGKKNKKYLRRL